MTMQSKTMTTQAQAGRVNQKQRTRMAIIDATRELIKDGGTVTMPAIARATLGSEATAYRYFPDLATLLREAEAGAWPPPAEALAPVDHSIDPVERIAYAAQYLLTGVLAHEGAARAMISAAIVRPESADMRPGHRFGLIDYALAPLAATIGQRDPDALEQLKRELAIVVSAEALFILTDLRGLTPGDAIASVVHAARTITTAAMAAA
jgi:AcrR family transcriptional regulator